MFVPHPSHLVELKSTLKDPSVLRLSYFDLLPTSFRFSEILGPDLKLWVRDLRSVVQKDRARMNLK